MWYKVKLNNIIVIEMILRCHRSTYNSADTLKEIKSK